MLDIIEKKGKTLEGQPYFTIFMYAHIFVSLSDPLSPCSEESSHLTKTH